MDWTLLRTILITIQHIISFTGVLVIFLGVLRALMQYFFYLTHREQETQNIMINNIRLHLGRVIILGLEFIVAADLIGTTTTPDYYSVGLLGIIVLIRTVLSYSINRELMTINKE